MIKLYAQGWRLANGTLGTRLHLSLRELSNRRAGVLRKACVESEIIQVESGKRSREQSLAR